MSLSQNTKMLEVHWPSANGKSGITSNGCNTLVNWKGTYEVLVVQKGVVSCYEPVRRKILCPMDQWGESFLNDNDRKGSAYFQDRKPIGHWGAYFLAQNIHTLGTLPLSPPPQ